MTSDGAGGGGDGGGKAGPGGKGESGCEGNPGGAEGVPGGLVETSGGSQYMTGIKGGTGACWGTAISSGMSTNLCGSISFAAVP